MGGQERLIYGWDSVNGEWIKIEVDEDGKLRLSDIDPMEVIQDTATDLKHLPHGRVTGNGVYAPFALTAAHKLQVEVDHLAHHERHEDGGDDEVSIADLEGESVELAAHKLVVNVHHSEEIADGRAKYGTTECLKIPGIGFRATTTEARTKNVIRYYPIYVNTPITINQVTIELTAAAGAGENCRIAIYAADIEWQPGALQVASAEIPIDAIAQVDTAITETTLQEGRYLMAMILEGNATFRTTRYTPATGEFLGQPPTLGANVIIAELWVGQVYGALPDPGTAWTAVNKSNEGIRYPIWLGVLTP